MSITAKDTQKIGRLARIRLSEEEVQHYTGEINNILGWIEKLQEVNTEGVPQMASVCEMTLPMRKDEVTDGGYQEEILKNAPANDYGCFVVPKVVE
jgi:aspartyl-tRNA(Asn)/glutamyl-tRNA(Gln) amidotransferase subunit C